MQINWSSNTKSASPTPGFKPATQPSAPTGLATGKTGADASKTGDPRVTGDAPHDFGVAKEMDFGTMPWGNTAGSTRASKPSATWWFSPSPPRYTYKPPFNVVSIFGGGGLIGNNGSSFRFW